MPVIDGDDYLQFQRNLIMESQAIYNRASQIENRRAQERQAAANRETQEKGMYVNMAMALKRLKFDEKVQAQREDYQNKNYDLQKQQFGLLKQLHTHQLALEKAKAEQGALRAKQMENELKAYEKTQTDLLAINKAWTALRKAKQPTGEDGTVDEAAIQQASLGLMQAFITGTPEAGSQFLKGQEAAGLTGFLGEELGGLKVQDLTATIDLKLAQAQASKAAAVRGQSTIAGVTTEEANRRWSWLESAEKAITKRHSTMTVAGFGTFQNPAEVAKAREDFFQGEWEQAKLVNDQISAIRTAGLLEGTALQSLQTNRKVLSAEGTAMLEMAKNELANYGDDKAKAKQDTLAAIKTLEAHQQRLARKASGYQLVEQLMTKREAQIQQNLYDVFIKNQASPTWKEDTLNTVEPALRAGDQAWQGILENPDTLAQIENFRAQPNPNDDQWLDISARIGKQLTDGGLDPAATKYVLGLIKATHPRSFSKPATE